MSITARRIAGLYAIADTSCIKGKVLAATVSQAIAGGARVVQYRDKRDDRARRREQAGLLARLCREAGVVFLVNDDVELAAEVGADGTHLGGGDTPLAAARERLGPQAIIGVSCYDDLARAEAAAHAGADYVAFGSFFRSQSKPEAVRADPELLRRARSSLRLPIVAIGGITPENGASLIDAGADALAVIEGLFGQADVCAAAKRYTRLFMKPT